MRLGTLLIAALACAAVSTPTAAGSPFSKTPDANDFARYYPRQAWMAEVEGRAVINCKVLHTGLMGTCAVVEESPVGMGFGEAALKMAPQFRMRPQTQDGQPVEGGQVRIPIIFKLPERQEVTAEVMLDDYVQCYGLIGAELDAQPNQARLVRALPFLQGLAREVGLHAELDTAAVDTRLAAARAKPSTDEAFGRTCRGLIDDWLAGR